MTTKRSSRPPLELWSEHGGREGSGADYHTLRTGVERLLISMRQTVTVAHTDKHGNRIQAKTSVEVHSVTVRKLAELLERSQELPFLLLVRQTRFRLERATAEETKKALAILGADYCATCGEYIGARAKGCQCATTEKPANEEAGES